jgi:hypothetical protein
METLKAVGLLFLALGAVFGLAYWKERRARKRKDKKSCCS